MKSMTGFGRGAASGDEFTVAVEIKTVNNRYLDIHLRLSQELSPLEMIVRKRIGARLSRGRVDLNINFERTGATTYEINRPLIAGYVSAMRDIQQQFNLAGDIDVSSVARLPGGLAQEVAYLADRSDISEELARLRSHIEQFRAAIDAEGEVGKRLDFLLQELNREANTVLSKSTEISIKDAGLAIKAEIEKLREQVQNVE